MICHYSVCKVTNESWEPNFCHDDVLKVTDGGLKVTEKGLGTTNLS